MQTYKTRVAIAGGGIGGLVMALQCHKKGVDCMVFEAVERLEPLGVGINLLPHSVKILAGLGLLEDLKALGIETAELAYFNKHGQAIWREPRGLAGGYDYPQISIHRGELHFMLLQNAIERLGADRVGLQFDVYHVQVTEGDITKRMEKYMPIIAHMQIADVPARNEPGTGEIGWEFVFRRMDQLGYKGWVGCEYRPAGDTVAGLGWRKKFGV